MFSKHPVFRVDTILYLGRLDCTLNQTSLFKFTEMLRHRSFCYRKHLMNIPEKTFIPLGKKAKYSDARWMPHSLGIPCKSLLFRSYFNFCHIYLVYCSQNYKQFLNLPNYFDKKMFHDFYGLLLPTGGSVSVILTTLVL